GTTVSAGGILSVKGPNAVTAGNIANSGTVTFDIGAANAANLTSTSFTGASGSTLNITTGTVTMPTANLNMPAASPRTGLLEGWNLWRPPLAQADWFTAIAPAQPNLGNGINGGVVTTVRQGNNTTGPLNNDIPGPANNFGWVNDNSWVYSGLIKTSASG